MKMELGFCLAALVATQALAQDTATLKKNAEEKTQAKMTQDLKQGVTFAEATLAPKSGSKMAGTVVFNRSDKGLQIVASVTGGTPGRHGIHIHEKGDCSAADASTAGGHFNPTGAPHAAPTAQARHVGDLGNITVKQDGVGLLSLDVPNVKGLTGWDAIVGKSVVVHAQGDDLKTQPSGASGDRIACGVIEATTGPSADAAKPTQK
ncbi:MAG TPA: superoxide dismutase family protein [Oligoflexus sp.]|uniref:superoxide dismutase family protein n=1 Tax=Oligoflexus sp. TaxID=1971216 RepID=UPI002D48EEC9|nr:superoxide dismutase family protein [Oligoflexus sp.]HYX37378.1 superoxide dismutase family protein [Oligoflexus sp.]